MDEASCKTLILNRFYEKCRIAGGPKPGYLLRKATLQVGVGEDRESDFEGDLAELVSQGVLDTNDESTLYFLTEKGVEVLTDLDA